MLTMGIFGFLNQVFPIAYSKFHMKHGKQNSADERRVDDDPDMFMEFHWHDLLGKRFRALRKGMTTAILYALIILGIVLEPSRYLHR